MAYYSKKLKEEKSGLKTRPISATMSKTASSKRKAMGSMSLSKMILNQVSDSHIKGASMKELKQYQNTEIINL